MSDFGELIKNFERIRDYMRQFFVYGCKVRNEYTQKSARTYDNERRRIESYLREYIKSDYASRGKQIFISVDCAQIAQNPLYAAWKSKSFTDNDLLLHFFIPAILLKGRRMTANELADAISATYGAAWDGQIIRLKLKEYEAEGIVEGSREGKAVYYRIKEKLPFEAAPETYLPAVRYFQGTAPFGFIGSTILDRDRAENAFFRFQHNYIVHTLEDGVLFDILKAVKEKRIIRFENKSSRTKRAGIQQGVPLKILAGVCTGRRYVAMYCEERRRYCNMRLDAISGVELLDECLEYTKIKEAFNRRLKACWGVSFGRDGAMRLEEIHMKLTIDEKKEARVINRLYREGRGGEVLKIKENTFLYSGAFFDTNEMLPWIKTFTGRILDIQGSNSFVINKLEKDLDTMCQMYL